MNMPPYLSELYLYISSYVCLDLSVSKVSIVFCSERRCVPGEQFKRSIQAITGHPAAAVLFDTQALAGEDTQAFQKVYRTLLRSHLFAITYMFPSPCPMMWYSNELLSGQIYVKCDLDLQPARTNVSNALLLLKDNNRAK